MWDVRGTCSHITHDFGEEFLLQLEAMLHVPSSGDYVMPATTMSMLLEMALVIPASPWISRKWDELGKEFW